MVINFLALYVGIIYLVLTFAGIAMAKNSKDYLLAFGLLLPPALLGMLLVVMQWG